VSSLVVASSSSLAAGEDGSPLVADHVATWCDVGTVVASSSSLAAGEDGSPLVADHTEASYDREIAECSAASADSGCDEDSGALTAAGERLTLEPSSMARTAAVAPTARPTVARTAGMILDGRSRGEGMVVTVMMSSCVSGCWCSS
jgi:hypothetical protein